MTHYYCADVLTMVAVLKTACSYGEQSAYMSAPDSIVDMVPASCTGSASWSQQVVSVALSTGVSITVTQASASSVQGPSNASAVSAS